MDALPAYVCYVDQACHAKVARDGRFSPKRQTAEMPKGNRSCSKVGSVYQSSERVVEGPAPFALASHVSLPGPSGK